MLKLIQPRPVFGQALCLQDGISEASTLEELLERIAGGLDAHHAHSVAVVTFHEAVRIVYSVDQSKVEGPLTDPELAAEQALLDFCRRTPRSI